jgi:hypothetical protein
MDFCFRFMLGLCGSGGCNGFTIVIGTNLVNYGYLEGSFGSIDDPTLDDNSHVYGTYVTPSDVFIMHIGVAGNEKTTGGADTMSVSVGNYGNIFLGWDETNLHYSGSAPGLYARAVAGDTLTACIVPISNNLLAFYAATYLTDYTAVVQKVGAGKTATNHVPSMWAPDYQGTPIEFPMDEPVWKDARVEINGMLLVIRTTTAN